MKTVFKKMRGSREPSRRTVFRTFKYPQEKRYMRFQKNSSEIMFFSTSVWSSKIKIWKGIFKKPMHLTIYMSFMRYEKNSLILAVFFCLLAVIPLYTACSEWHMCSQNSKNKNPLPSTVSSDLDCYGILTISGSVCLYSRYFRTTTRSFRFLTCW